MKKEEYLKILESVEFLHKAHERTREFDNGVLMVLDILEAFVEKKK